MGDRAHRVLGVWNRVLGVWNRVLGAWNRVLGVWNRVLGVWNRVLGVWNRVGGFRHLGVRSLQQHAGDHGVWTRTVLRAHGWHASLLLDDVRRRVT